MMADHDPVYGLDLGTAAGDRAVMFEAWHDGNTLRVVRIYESEFDQLYARRQHDENVRLLREMSRVMFPDPVQHVVRDPRDPRRWFDVFRTPRQAYRPVCDFAQVSKFRRPQLLADHAQRRRHKRKRFLEALRS